MTLLDTDILIDVARGITEAKDYLKDLDARDVAAISVMTQMEIIVGCRDKAELQKLDKFLSQFQILPLDGAVGDKLRLYRLSHGLLIADSLIAATAIIAGVPFVSKDQRDYKFIVGLNLLAYP